MGTIKEVAAVIDTNVVVSALLFGGTPGRLIPSWKDGRIKAYASRETVDKITEEGRYGYVIALSNPSVAQNFKQL